MSAEEKELNEWIHCNVFSVESKMVGLKRRGYWYRHKAAGYTDREREAGRFTPEEAKKHEYPHDEPVTIHEFSIPHYTSGENFQELLEKCLERQPGILGIQGKGGGSNVFLVGSEFSDTLPLALVKFARKLFEK